MKNAFVQKEPLAQCNHCILWNSIQRSNEGQMRRKGSECREEGH